MKRWLMLFGVLCLLAAPLCGTGLAKPFTGSPAAMNPAFIAWREQQKIPSRGVRSVLRVKSGLVPEPMDWSHLAKANYNFPRAGAAPSSYDASRNNYVTPVRNQGSYGTCWAFATMASLESSWMKRTSAAKDLSERHLAWFVYNGDGQFPSFTKTQPAGAHEIYDQGGNTQQSAAALTRWTGPADETASPYASMPAPAVNTTPRALDVTDVWRAEIAPINGSNPLSDRAQTYAVIKKWVMEEGAVVVAFNAGSGSTQDGSGQSLYYNADTASYYYDGTLGINHFVTIVGWKDNHLKENFNASKRPAGDGAWLCKNSWGDDWGENGYFWLSYYDTSLAAPTLFKGKDLGGYKKMYLNDPLGATSSWGYNNQTSMWGANVFTATENGKIGAVAFNTNDVGTDYEIRIYKNPAENKPSSGALVTASTTTGSLTYAGYHTVQLKQPAEIRSGEKFSVVIKIFRLEAPIYFPMEMPISSYSTEATGKRGESFFTNAASVDAATLWEDCYDIEVEGAQDNPISPGSNICIRALTSPAPASRSSGGCDAGAGALALLAVVWTLRKRQE